MGDVCDALADLLHIVDFFDATHNQDALMDSLYPNSAKHENMVNNLKHSDAADIKCFDICSDGADWDLWYLESSGWDKTELSSHKLLPSLNPESIDIQVCGKLPAKLALQRTLC